MEIKNLISYIVNYNYVEFFKKKINLYFSPISKVIEFFQQREKLIQDEDIHQFIRMRSIKNTTVKKDSITVIIENSTTLLSMYGMTELHNRRDAA